MFKKRNFICFLIIFSIVLYALAGCGSGKDNIILLDEPDSITYPEYYDLAIEDYPSDLTVAPISDYKDAAEKGQQLWQQELKHFTDDYLERNIEVFYVPEDDTWVVTGTLPEDWVGLLPIAIIQSDGTVLSVGWI